MKPPRSREKRTSSPARHRSGKRVSSGSNSKLWLWVFLGGIAALIVVAVVVDSNRKRAIVESLQVSDELAKIKQEYARLSKTPKSSSMPVRVDAMEKRIELTKEAMKIAKHEADREWADLNYLKSLVFLESTRFGAQLPRSDYFNELLQTLDNFNENPSAVVVRESRVARLIIVMLDYMRGEDRDASKVQVVDNIKSLTDMYPNDPKLAIDLGRAALLLSTQPEYRDFRIEVLQLLSDTFCGSENGKLDAFGRRCATDLVLAKYEIPQTEKRLITDAPVAAAEIIQKLELVAENETMTPDLLLRLVGSCQAMEAFRHRETAVKGYERLGEVAAGMSGETTELAVAKMAHGTTRCTSIGSPFQLDVTTLKGESLDNSQFADKPIIVCFLSGYGEKLGEVFDVMARFELSNKGSVDFVFTIIEGDQEELTQMIKGSRLNNSHVVLDQDRSSSIHKQFPVETLPSFLIVDKDHKILDVVIRMRELQPTVRDLTYDQN